MGSPPRRLSACRAAGPAAVVSFPLSVKEQCQLTGLHHAGAYHTLIARQLNNRAPIARRATEAARLRIVGWDAPSHGRIPPFPLVTPSFRACRGISPLLDYTAMAWTKERIEKMIADGVEEGPTLDYKRAASLEKSDDKRIEITKDVSSFANSSGGTIIYGVAEFQDGDRRHLPERPDPIQRAEISKEWLEQIIQTIQPRIEGLQVYPVAWDEKANTVCYVVEIPQSDTAHQARDHRYHMRYNFTTQAMEDYQVRDVMNRGTHPRIRGWIFVNKHPGRPGEGTILVRLKNVGRILARHFMVHLQLPLDMNGLISVQGPVVMHEREDGFCHELRLMPESAESPLFPGSDTTLQRPIRTDISEWRHVNGRPMDSVRDVRVRMFADEMPAIEATLEVGSVLFDWAEVSTPAPAP